MRDIAYILSCFLAGLIIGQLAVTINPNIMHNVLGLIVVILLSGSTAFILHYLFFNILKNKP